MAKLNQEQAVIRIPNPDKKGDELTNRDGGDLGEYIEHGVAVDVDDVVAERPVVVSEEVNRVHALDLAEVKCWQCKDRYVASMILLIDG